MDSFVEAQNNLKRMSYAGCVILFKTRQSHAVRFSFMLMVMKSTGLKPIEAQNARSSSAWVPYLASQATASAWYSSWACIESSRIRNMRYLHTMLRILGPNRLEKLSNYLARN